MSRHNKKTKPSQKRYKTVVANNLSSFFEISLTAFTSILDSLPVGKRKYYNVYKRKP
jgi:hypothetical protein